MPERRIDRNVRRDETQLLLQQKKAKTSRRAAVAPPLDLNLYVLLFERSRRPSCGRDPNGLLGQTFDPPARGAEKMRVLGLFVRGALIDALEAPQVIAHVDAPHEPRVAEIHQIPIHGRAIPTVRR